MYDNSESESDKTRICKREIDFGTIFFVLESKMLTSHYIKWPLNDSGDINSFKKGNYGGWTEF